MESYTIGNMEFRGFGNECYHAFIIGLCTIDSLQTIKHEYNVNNEKWTNELFEIGFRLACKYNRLEIAQWIHSLNKINCVDEIYFENIIGQSNCYDFIKWLFTIGYSMNLPFVKICVSDYIESYKYYDYELFRFLYSKGADLSRLPNHIIKMRKKRRDSDLLIELLFKHFKKELEKESNITLHFAMSFIELMQNDPLFEINLIGIVKGFLFL